MSAREEGKEKAKVRYGGLSSLRRIARPKRLGASTNPFYARARWGSPPREGPQRSQKKKEVRRGNSSIMVKGL